MFLFIFEDFTIWKGPEADEDTRQSSDDGYVTIIDISGEEPKQYSDGEWHDIEEAKA